MSDYLEPKGKRALVTGGTKGISEAVVATLREAGPACAFKQKPTVSLCKKTVRWSVNLILISWTGFLIDFLLKIAF